MFGITSNNAQHAGAQRFPSPVSTSPQTLALRECMLANREYYAPLLEEEEEAARKAQEQDAVLEEIQQERDRQRAAAATGVVDEEAAPEKPGVSV